MKTLNTLFIVGFLAGTLIVIGQVHAQYACSPDLLEVLFQPEYAFRLRDDRLITQGVAQSDAMRLMMEDMAPVQWERLTERVAEQTLDQMHQQAETRLGRPVYNLNNIFYLRLSGGQDVWLVAEQLKNLPEVLNAYPVPQPMPLPTPNWQDDQDYLNNEPDWPPTGFSAYSAWTDLGGNGLGVTVCDLEYSWNTQHVDLTKSVNSQKNPYAQDPYSDTHHGTAVLGEMIADNNGWGVTGMCYGADIITYGTYYDPNPPHTTPDWRLPAAMLEAASYLKAGDVMLLEQQWRYTLGQDNFIPVEWWGNFSPNNQSYNAVYATIESLTANGIHVVEAAGNGGVDLDALTWWGDSGAIIVGAGGVTSGGFYPEGDLAPISFSCYGVRVNVQGWGEDVSTTGYGSYTGSTGLNDMFCWDFAGTSSASPMVAAAVACCVGYWTQSYSMPAASLTPSDMRSILMQTGTPQDPFTNRQIGPRPDIAQAFKALDARAPAYFYEVTLQMPSTFYNAGDPFSLGAIVNNPGPHGGTAPLVIVLDVMGSYWFYPTWTNAFAYDNYSLVHGAVGINVIPSFNWPAGAGTLNGLHFYGALLTTDFSSIWGLYDSVTFGFSS